MTVFLPNDRVVSNTGRAGRVWLVRSDGRVLVVFDDHDMPVDCDPYDIEHDVPEREQRLGTDVIGFDERERRAVAEVDCRMCGATPGAQCVSVIKPFTPLPHPHYSRWCDVVVEREVLPEPDEVRRVPDGGPESIDRYSVSERQDISDAGRGHLL